MGLVSAGHSGSVELVFAWNSGSEGLVFARNNESVISDCLLGKVGVSETHVGVTD